MLPGTPVYYQTIASVLPVYYQCIARNLFRKGRITDGSSQAKDSLHSTLQWSFLVHFSSEMNYQFRTSTYDRRFKLMRNGELFDFRQPRHKFHCVLCIGTHFFPPDLTTKIECVLCTSAHNTPRCTVYRNFFVCETLKFH